MKWKRTLILADNGNVMSSSEWHDLHEAYVQAIKSIVNPPGGADFTIREKMRNHDGQWLRNGVRPIRDAFFAIMRDLGWRGEERVELIKNKSGLETTVLLFPARETALEPCTSDYGEFDFYIARNGVRTVIEWETGNISSSHRSVNKLCVCLKAGIIDAGVLIVPSRDLYEHLTDRVGNIGELSGYLKLWQSVVQTLDRGLLAITVVEHDRSSTSSEIPYIERGQDGNSLKRKARLSAPQAPNQTDRGLL